MALEIAEQLEAVWWLFCVGFIFLGLVGLSLIEAGMSREKFSEAALIKNLIQFALAAVCWWLLGFGFAFGHVDFGFLGVELFGGKAWLGTLLPLKATAIGFVGVSVLFIINGAIAERTHYILYVVLTLVLMLFAWPVVVAWCWGKGWLFNMADSFLDDGGCATVHLFSGSIALVGVLFVKHRSDRFEQADSSREYSLANTVYLTLGTIFYFIHLCFLNALFAPTIEKRGYAMFNTWLGAGMGAIVACMFGSFWKKKVEVQFVFLLRGFIAGAIIVSSIADNVMGWAIFCFGVIGGLLFIITYRVEEKLGVDDVTLVVPVHFIQGLVGTFGVGLWNTDMGGFHNNTGLLIGTQFAGLLSIMGWGLIFGIGIFGFLYLIEFLTIDKYLQKYGVKDAPMGVLGFQVSEVKDVDGIELQQKDS